MTLDEYIEKNGSRGYDEESDRKYCERINYIVDEGAKFSDNRKPYFRMRGKKVTPVQAFDIISKTERTILWNFELLDEQYDFGYFLCCAAFESTDHTLFVRPDGYFGINDICGIKYPEQFDLFASLARLLYHFPYLDFVVAFADWEEIPDYAYETLNSTKEYLVYNYEGFEESIDFGIHVYNGTIHHLNKENARKLYEEYNKKYGYANQAIYCEDYYDGCTRELFTNEYIEEVFKVHGKKIDDVKNKMACEDLKKKRTCVDDELLFTYKMLFAEKNFGEPAKFKAWHMAQFLYDALEMGYSYDDAWSLLVESTVGQNLLRGTFPDASASEADTELSSRYERKFKEKLPNVEMLTSILTVLLEVAEKYQLPLKTIFGNLTFGNLCYRYNYNISCEDLYNILMGGE